jgi:ribosomal protein S18 acetylase RimI-like enzyme
MTSRAATLRRSRSRVLTDATADQLADAVQRNQAEWIRFEGKLPDVELHDDPDVTWVCSSALGRPNSVALARLTPQAADRRIERILEGYRQVSASNVWWIGPLSRPDDLGTRLRAAGFHCFKHFPGMALDARRLRTFAAPKELKIQQLVDFSVFENAEHPFFGPPTTERRRNFIDGERRLCAARPQRLFAFIASIDGEPLGHAMAFLGAGVAGIYDVGVVRRARGRGIGTAVTLAAVRHARKLGYRYAVLQASGEGEHVYQRMGFEEVCRISLWFHSRRHHDPAE